MHFKVIEDNYYDGILHRLRTLVPNFHFDDPEPYLVLFQFSQYMIENINNENVLTTCLQFIDDAVINGGNKTEQLIVLQVFQNLYVRKYYVDICRKYLKGKVAKLFEESQDEYLKDYEQSP